MARKSKSSHSAKKDKKSGIASFLHPQEIQPSWQMLPHLLLLAFALRAIASLAGDFVIHPDEIMQYLEPAHQVVFGAGVSYWEYFYGARSWLVPGLVASVLWLCNLLGLDSPTIYIALVKLTFCALSLFIPWGMYHFARRHWSESVARFALLFGIFWYELVVFAHKPLTEFVATSLLFLLLAIFPMSPAHRETPYIKQAAFAGALCALVVAVRLQYAPVAALIFILSWLALGENGMRARIALLASAAGVTIIIGLLEMLAWGVPFHSYYTNFTMNVMFDRSGESSPLIIIGWFLLASCGVVSLAIYGIFGHLRRRGIVALILLLILIPHMMQDHREYRFLFFLIPLWLLLFADFIIVAAEAHKKSEHIRRFALSVAVVISVAGILNLIPFQNKIYTGFSQETGRVDFLHNQDPIFALYRDLGTDDSVQGVVDTTRTYFNTGGYYYLHHSKPFYDLHSWSVVEQKEAPEKYVSHLITNLSISGATSLTVFRGRTFLLSESNPLPLPAYTESAEGELLYWNQVGQSSPLSTFEIANRYPDSKNEQDIVLWKTKSDSPVREWKDYRVYPDAQAMRTNFDHLKITEKLISLPTIPENLGIEFVDDTSQ